MKKDCTKELRKRNLRPKFYVHIISGSYKSKQYQIDKILKNGYLYLKGLELINSNKKVYKVKVHHSNVMLRK